MNNNKRLTAREALVETFGYYKYSVTQFEADLWSMVIDEFGDEVVLAFLQTHLRSSQFAPKISDAQKLLAPGRGNDEAAFLELTAAVRRWGPYASPIFRDPAIRGAVVQLGGWPAVNEQLPAPSAVHEYEMFRRRFAAAYQVARSEQSIHHVAVPPLRGLHALTDDGDPALHLQDAHQPLRPAAQVAHVSAAP